MLLAKPLSHAVLRQAESAASSAPVKKAAVKVVKGTPAVPKHLGAVKPKLARAHTGILVLNGNGRTGAASAEAATLQHSATRRPPPRTPLATTTRRRS